MIGKTCPVLLHPDGAPPRLVLQHAPDGTTQLVSATIGTGETPGRLAMETAFELCALESTSALLLGSDDSIQTGEIWHFVLCRIKPPVRENWQHFARATGGHLFKFSWAPLNEPSPKMDQKSERAFDWISRNVT